MVELNEKLYALIKARRESKLPPRLLCIVQNAA